MVGEVDRGGRQADLWLLGRLGRRGGLGGGR